MKKTMLILFILLSIIVVTASIASAEDMRCNLHKLAPVSDLSETVGWFDFKLPDSVVVIEEEAFEGTSIVAIELPASVKTIGEQAFANIKTLRSIHIPMSTTAIASTAFIGSENVTINAITNSYAREFAKAQGLPFAPVAMLCASNLGKVIISITRDFRLFEYTILPEKNEPERHWREFENIYSVGTLDIIFNEIQSRGPPKWEVPC